MWRVRLRGSGLSSCSSGRVVRPLAAAFPHIHWRGCDPNEAAIAWASRHLTEIEFFVSPQLPPLPIARGELDLVYAISIWSHFAPDLGLRWFDEMHRVIKPGGLLAITTHGLQSVSYYAETGLRPSSQCRDILDSLYRSGFWYAPEFGKAGDFGIVNPDWGTAFLSPEWLLTKLCPSWRIRLRARAQSAQPRRVHPATCLSLFSLRGSSVTGARVNRTTVSVIIPVKNGKEYLAGSCRPSNLKVRMRCSSSTPGPETGRSRSHEGSERPCWRFLPRSSGTVVPGISGQSGRAGISSVF